ncbi:MAG: histidine phosphatase family protein [Bacteroidota bacterium]
MKKTIYFIRHGQTEYNKLRIIQGSGVDSDLNATGSQQGLQFYEMYKSVPFQVVLTSTLKRTHQTVANFIKDGIPWEQFEAINEMHWGIHEGKTGNPEMHKDYIRVVGSGTFDERIAGGESINDVVARLKVFIQHLEKRAEEYLLVCLHGRTMRVLMCMLDENDLTKMDDYPHANTGLYLVEYENQKFRILERNLLDHLD